MVIGRALLALALFVPQAFEGDTLARQIVHDQVAQAVTLGAPGHDAQIMSFFYTRCPDITICANTSGKFAWLQTHLTPHDHIQLFEITLDPTHDTSTALARYAAIYRADSRIWHLVRTSPEITAQLATRLGVTVSSDAKNLRHSEVIVVLDPQGRIVQRTLGATWLPEDILAAAKATLGVQRSWSTQLSAWLNTPAAAACGVPLPLPLTTAEALLLGLATIAISYLALMRGFTT
jgi:cytochrome oxidase Cu insertion factor (SCO1/SenC/PrrC family)